MFVYLLFRSVNAGMYRNYEFSIGGAKVIFLTKILFKAGTGKFFF